VESFDSNQDSVDATSRSNDDSFRGAGDQQRLPGEFSPSGGNVGGDFKLSSEQQRAGYGITGAPGDTTAADGSTYGPGGDFAYPGASSGGCDDERDQQFHAKPSMGDKVIGNFEKVVGKVTRHPDLQERGQERKTGEF